MTNEASISALLGLIEKRQSFLVTSHARPDGDAIGSSLAMMYLLEALGKDVVVAFADPIPEPFQCLEGIDRMVHQLPSARPDAAILLECDCIQRSGFDRIDAGLTINIDHHLSGRSFADFNWIDPTCCAVGAMVYDLALAAGVTIHTAMADALYAAVLTDTGAFNYPSTTASTFALAEHLVQCGTSPNRIAQAVYFSYPASKLRLLGSALSNMELHGPFCWSTITLADMHRTGATVEDCEGIVNHLIAIAGIEAAVLLREQPGGAEFRVSLRSKGTGDVDVSQVAEHFGGGGHRNASGCSLRGAAGSVVRALLDRLQCQIDASAAAQAQTAAPIPAAPSTLLA